MTTAQREGFVVVCVSEARLQQHKRVFSQFWRLEVYGQGVGRAGSPEASLFGV